MQTAYTLPRSNGRDIVQEIRQKREAVKRQKIRERCLRIESCDCRRCK